MDKKIKCEIYSRCCGFFRPINLWNKGKREEFKDRKVMDLDKIKDRLEK